MSRGHVEDQWSPGGFSMVIAFLVIAIVLFLSIPYSQNPATQEALKPTFDSLIATVERNAFILSIIALTGAVLLLRGGGPV